MTENAPKRKLTAIFGSDVKGYRKLLGDDGESPVNIITVYRKITKELGQKRREGGDTLADNILTAFKGALNAVSSNIGNQKRLEIKNSKLSCNRLMDYRLGTLCATKTISTPLFAAFVFGTLMASIFLFNTTALAESYKYGPKSNRMEGLRRIPTGGAGINLQSFIAYRETMTLSEDLVMKIRFYLPGAGSAFIYSVESRRHKISHYLMRPFNSKWNGGWNEFTPWPAKDVLFPLSISPDDIDIVVRLGSDQPGSGNIAPAILYSNAENLPAEVVRYTVAFLPNVSLSYAEFSLIHVDSGKTIRSGQKRNIGANVTFTIDLDLSDNPRGMYRLLMQTEEYGRTKGPSRHYFFHHVPLVQR